MVQVRIQQRYHCLYSDYIILKLTFSEPRWQVKNLDINAIYSFRCRASNIYGWGSYSEDSTPVSMAAISTVVAEPQNVGLILGVIALALFILVPLALGFIYRKYLMSTIFIK